jgi:hypothetical protein
MAARLRENPKKAACFDGMYNEGNSDGLDYY